MTDSAAQYTGSAQHAASAPPDGTHEEYWDGRYRESDRIWSGNPNAELLRETPDLEPGTALDLGCGEGADAIWLARQGWKVTAVDISGVALERAARHAAEEGVEGIDWQRRDLGSSFPEGEFDLVSAHFLHSIGDMPRESILRAAARAVAPGGVLLVVGHAVPPSQHGHHPDVHFPTPREVLDSLHLPEDEWVVERCEEHERTQADADGQAVTRTDNTLRVRRVRNVPRR